MSKAAKAYVEFCDRWDFFLPPRRNGKYQQFRAQLDKLIDMCGGSAPDDDEIAEEMGKEEAKE